MRLSDSPRWHVCNNYANKLLSARCIRWTNQEIWIWEHPSMWFLTSIVSTQQDIPAFLHNEKFTSCVRIVDALYLITPLLKSAFFCLRSPLWQMIYRPLLQMLGRTEQQDIRNFMVHPFRIDFNAASKWGLVIYICPSKLGHHWFG